MITKFSGKFAIIMFKNFVGVAWLTWMPHPLLKIVQIHMTHPVGWVYLVNRLLGYPSPQLPNRHSFWTASKGQLISKCPFGVKTSSKKPTEIFLDFCPEIFCTFLGASWKLFGASCRLPCLWYWILSPQEAQKASMKPPGSYKKQDRRYPDPKARND